jgi:intron-binding protein aquarius
MSRARLGLYVFGRQSLFQNCLELTNTFNVLLAKPTKLTLVPGEQFGSCARKVSSSRARLRTRLHAAPRSRRACCHS